MRMHDLEKVIRAMECCTAPVPCTGCPYVKTIRGCRDMKLKALALLRELQAMKRAEEDDRK